MYKEYQAYEVHFPPRVVILSEVMERSRENRTIIVRLWAVLTKVTAATYVGSFPRTARGLVTSAALGNTIMRVSVGLLDSKQ